jgi:hypothetical protein
MEQFQVELVLVRGIAPLSLTLEDELSLAQFLQGLFQRILALHKPVEVVEKRGMRNRRPDVCGDVEYHFLRNRPLQGIQTLLRETSALVFHPFLNDAQQKGLQVIAGKQSILQAEHEKAVEGQGK